MSESLPIIQDVQVSEIMCKLDDQVGSRKTEVSGSGREEEDRRGKKRREMKGRKIIITNNYILSTGINSQCTP